nr:DUF1345 domain-containing protein [Rhizobium mesoamericanum]
MAEGGGDREGQIVGQVRKHMVFAVALIAGLVTFLLLTSRQVNPRNLVVGWNVGAIVFTALTWRRMLRASVASIRKRAEDLDYSDVVVLSLSILAALASIAGIALELHFAKDTGRSEALVRALVAIVTILNSWVFLHTLFTVHYAHRFYGGEDKGEGLKFPEGNDEPVYWDFLYYSFTIGVASQTADVATTSTAMRKLTLLHSVLSFLFNTTILALAVNVGASLLG